MKLNKSDKNVYRSWIVFVILFLAALRKPKLFIPLILHYKRMCVFIPLILYCLMMIFVLKKTGYFQTLCSIIFERILTLQSNFEDLPKEPCILVSNYPQWNFIEHMINAVIPRKLCVVSNSDKKFVVKSISHTKKSYIFVDEKRRSNYSRMKYLINKRLDEGYTIFVYVEDPGKRRNCYDVNKIRRGIFSIAQEIGRPVVPITVDHFYHSLGYIPEQNFYINVSRPIMVDDVEETVEKVKKIYQTNLWSFHSKKNLNL